VPKFGLPTALARGDDPPNPPAVLPRIGWPSLRVAVPRVSLGAIRLWVTWTITTATLFLCYIHVASSAVVTSDGASNALQAWDMLHGNLLLHGWRLSDVSFYTTELPQYLVIERFTGLTPEVVHVASAMTYTLLILLAMMAAKAMTTGREAIARCLLAAGIMAAPQAGNGVYVLLGSPDHVGSTVPVLLAFLLLDRAPRRWYTVAGAGSLLGLALIADGIAMYTGVLPVVIVCGARIYQARIAAAQRWRTVIFDLALGAAALCAVWLSSLTLAAVRSGGGFMVWPVPRALAAPADVPHYLITTARGLLLLFGANFFSHNAGLVAFLAAARLIGLGLAAWAVCAVIRRFGSADLAAQLLAAGAVVVLAAYALGTRAGGLLTARDLAAVLPFGAALAGRLLPSRLAPARLLPAMGVLLACYLFSLGRIVTLPPAQAANGDLAAWLAEHHLTYGLAGYWNANITTLDTGGKVVLRSVLADGSHIAGDYWEVKSSWYNPKLNDANFIVLVPGPPGFKRYPTVGSVRATFGQPRQIYFIGEYTVVVYDKNLLAELVPGAPLPPRTTQNGPPAIPLPGPLWPPSSYRRRARARRLLRD
jgi:hypothetical protein